MAKQKKDEVAVNGKHEGWFLIVAAAERILSTSLGRISDVERAELLQNLQCQLCARVNELIPVKRLDEVLAKVIQANSLLNEQFPTISIRFLASHGDREMLHDLVAEHAPDMVLWTVDSKSGEFAITTKEIAREAMKAMDHLNAIENSASRLQQMICSRQKRCGHTFRHSAFDTETGL